MSGFIEPKAAEEIWWYMNKIDVFTVIMAASGVMAYLFGRLHRIFGIVIGGIIFAASFIILLQLQVDIWPYILLSAWSVIAIFHSFYTGRFDISSSVSKQIKDTEVQNKNLRYKLKKNKEEFVALVKSEKEALIMYSAIKLLSEAVDIENVKKYFAKALKDYFQTDTFAFYMKNFAGGESMDLFALGPKNFEFDAWPKVFALSESSNKDFSFPFVYGSEKKVFFVPAKYGDDICGLFAAEFSNSGEKDSAILDKMSDFCRQIAFAIRRIQLFAQVDCLSRIDGLTGVYRRNVLDEKIEEEIRRSNSFKTTFGFMIADIDHFKNLNDKYGHQFGDFVLKRIGDILKSSVYETDFIGRYGGEEFGIVLPRADFEGVLRKAESIRTSIEREVFQQGLESVRITVSIGIAHFPRDGFTSKEVIRKADKALYYAKDSGRNTVVDAASI
ncbi:MAG: GGDEF domain-containing protein [Elusimicrobia bacterium]|nr:GGDEF domain-containing protein [Elusimicrobiota bacterium]